MGGKRTLSSTLLGSWRVAGLLRCEQNYYDLNRLGPRHIRVYEASLAER